MLSYKLFPPGERGPALHCNKLILQRFALGAFKLVRKPLDAMQAPIGRSWTINGARG
jgi:hypothetical protein